MTQPLATSPPSRRPNILVALAVLISQGPTLARSFVWDDTITMDIIRLRGLQNPFLPDPFNFFRPGKMALFELQYFLFGPNNPLPWQAVTLIAALVVSLLTLRLLTKLIGPGAALAGALMIAVHPMQVEATGWISASNGTWMLCAMLGYFLLMLRMAETPPPQRPMAAGAVGLLILALLMKEEAVMAPFLAAVLLWLVGTLSRRITIKLAGHLVLCATFAALGHVISSGAGQSLEPLNFPPWVISLTAPGRIFAHMAAFYWPFGWMYYRDFTMPTITFFVVLIGGLAGVIALAACAWRMRRSPHPIVAGLIFGVFAMLPASNIIPIGNNMWGARYLMPASVGLAMAGACVWDKLRRNGKGRRTLLTVAGTLWLIVATITTWWGHTNWRTTIGLMEKLSSTSERADWLHLKTREQYKTGQYEAALVTADQTIDASHRWENTWNKDHELLMRLGLSSLDPKTTTLLIAQAFTNRVLILEQLGRTEEAWQTIQEGIALDPDHAPLMLRMADHFHEQYKTSRSSTDLSEAERYYQKAARSSPETAETAWSNLGLLYVDAGREDLAIKVWQQGLEIMPGSATMRHNLGIALKNSDAKNAPSPSPPQP